MKLNTPARGPRNFEGAPAVPPGSPLKELRRAVSSCLLWESTFYEDGIEIADRIASLVPLCGTADVAALAIEARQRMGLRHAPLLLAVEMARHKPHRSSVRATVAGVVKRADELAELLTIYWRNGRCSVAHSVRHGLADALRGFDAYQLAKYDRDGKVKLRDVLRLVRPKPANDEQRALWGKLVKGELESPDTWEVALSAGKDKRETFERLIAEKKLGGLALLRNLRNMVQAGVPRDAMRSALDSARFQGVLPFQFISAARHAPGLEADIEARMLESAAEMPKLSGTTVLLVDISPSMGVSLSAKSELTRIEAACALAILAREMCEDVRVFSFSSRLVEVPARRGFALGEAIVRSQPSNGTLLGAAVANAPMADRMIAVTDEESQDPVGPPKGLGYMMNVAVHKNGVGYGPWTRIDGFSERALAYIREAESVHA